MESLALGVGTSGESSVCARAYVFPAKRGRRRQLEYGARIIA